MHKYTVKRHVVTQPLGTSYRFIPLTQKQNAIVDASDFDWLNQWNWSARWSKNTESFYALRRGQEHTTVLMSRSILGCNGQVQVDHRNHNTLDNRRHNLRTCTGSQNSMNKRKQKNNTSGYRGVSWMKDYRKFRARIFVNRKLLLIGYFSDAVSAARAYDSKAKELHGAFARLNFPNV